MNNEMWYIYKMEYGSAIKKIKLLKMQANGWSYKQSKGGNPDLERQMYYLFYHLKNYIQNDQNSI